MALELLLMLLSVTCVSCWWCGGAPLTPAVAQPASLGLGPLYVYGACIALFFACLPYGPLADGVGSWHTLHVILLSHTLALAPLMSMAARGVLRRAYILGLAYVIVVASILLLQATTLLMLLVAFETMLFAALALLIATSKGERVLIAVGEMYIWAILGSGCFIGALTFHVIGSLFVGAGGDGLSGYGPIACGSTIIMSCANLLLAIGFMVKIPLWPCGSWLIRAHVEASTEFSIYLSGFLVKFGVLGLVRVLGIGQAGNLCDVVSVVALVGVCDATCRLLVQSDLKRIVALTTVIETNWLAYCLSCGLPLCERLGITLILAHCITTTLEFSLVELLYRRYQTRSAFNVSGVLTCYPTLGRFAWIVALTTLGVPGTVLFSLKIAFLMAVAGTYHNVLWLWALMFLGVQPIFFLRLWAVVLGGHRLSWVATPLPSDLTRHEALGVLPALCLNILLGVYPSLAI